jgi:hypothetical protein
MEISMTTVTRNRRFGRLAAATIAVIGLGALTIPLTPAKAQLYFGFGPGGFGVAVGTPYYYPYYDPYYPAYPAYPAYPYWGW